MRFPVLAVLLATLVSVSCVGALDVWSVSIENTDSQDHNNELVVLDISDIDCHYGDRRDLRLYYDGDPSDFELHGDTMLFLADTDEDETNTDFIITCDQEGLSDASTRITLFFDDFESYDDGDMPEDSSDSTGDIEVTDTKKTNHANTRFYILSR